MTNHDAYDTYNANRQRVQRVFDPETYAKEMTQNLPRNPPLPNVDWVKAREHAGVSRRPVTLRMWLASVFRSWAVRLDP